MSDAIKTIREALDDLWFVAPEPPSKARAALDSLEAELTTLRTGAGREFAAIDAKWRTGWERDQAELASIKEAYRLATVRASLSAAKVEALETELATLRARLAPADSPPGDEELTSELALFLRDLAGKGHDANDYIDDARSVVGFFREQRYLRSQQPETEKQRAETPAHQEYREMLRRLEADVDLYFELGRFDCKRRLSNGAVVSVTITTPPLAKAKDAEGGR